MKTAILFVPFFFGSALLWAATPAKPQGFRFGAGIPLPAGTPAYFYITQQRLVELQAKVAANAPKWVFMRQTVDTYRNDVTHTLVNMAGSVNVAVSRAGGNTTVTVSAGGGHLASPEGIVRFTN